MDDTSTMLKVIRYKDSLSRDFRIFPPSLHVSLTDLCWNNCRICGHWKRPNPSTLNFSQLWDLLEIGSENGLETVCFTGGDPLHYPMINTAMKACKDLDIDYGIVTAGYCPPEVDIDLVAEAKWVRCSIDAVGNDAYSKVRGGSIGWQDIEESLTRLHKRSINLQVFVTVSTYNLEDLEDLFGWIFNRQDWFSEVRARTAYKHSGKDAKLPKWVGDFFNKWSGAYLKFDRRVDFVAEQFNPKPFDRCWAARYQMFVDATGDIYPCCITAGDTEKATRIKPLGNIKDPLNTYLNAIAVWSKENSSQLPSICRKECAPRLNLINVVCSDSTMNEKNFF